MSTNVQSHIGTLSGGGFRTGSMSPCSRERAALRKESLSPGWGQEQQKGTESSILLSLQKVTSRWGWQEDEVLFLWEGPVRSKARGGACFWEGGLLESICVCACACVCVCVCVHALRFIVAGTFECRMEYICVWVLVHIGGDCQFLCCCIWPRTS